MSEIEMNQRLAEEICDAGRMNGKQFRKGECVALLDGKVVAVTNDLASAVRALRALDSDPLRGMVVEIGYQAIDVIR